MIASSTSHAEPSFLRIAPVYRVNFWEEVDGGAWALDAFVLTDVDDVFQAMRWVDDHRDGRAVELFVEAEESPAGAVRTSGLIRLMGSNPNSGVTIPIGRFVPTPSAQH